VLVLREFCSYSLYPWSTELQCGGHPNCPLPLSPAVCQGLFPPASEILEIETPGGVGGRLALSTCFTG